MPSSDSRLQLKDPQMAAANANNLTVAGMWDEHAVGFGSKVILGNSSRGVVGRALTRFFRLFFFVLAAVRTISPTPEASCERYDEWMSSRIEACFAQGLLVRPSDSRTNLLHVVRA